jgi:pilus assembly protein CpaF
VREIVGVPGRVENDVVEAEDVFTSRDGRLVRANGFPPHPERFARAGLDLTQLLGTSCPSSSAAHAEPVGAPG